MAALIAEGCAQIGGAVEVRLRCVPGSVNHWDKPGCRDEVADGEATFADVGWADGIACGTPTNLGCVSWRMKKFWDDLSQSGMWSAIDGKVGVSFSSQGGDGGGAELVCMAMNHIMINFGFSVIGITDYVSFKKTCHYGAVCSKVRVPYKFRSF
jgi:NAD(P)H dehydrogenase (quinone)